MKRLGFIAAAILAAGPALADQIDGTWFRPNSIERMFIDGARVVTPGGNEVIARYTPHAIDYAVPEGERPDGGRIYAEKLNDREINVSYFLKAQKEPPAHDIWTRCDDLS